MLAPARVGERAKDIEDRTDAEFLSDRTYIFHGKMVFLGEKEADIDIGKKLFALFRGNVDLDTQSFQNVSGS